MRKASWGAILLGIFALATMWPFSAVPGIHALSLAAIAGIVLLWIDPPTRRVDLQRILLGLAILAGILSFALVQMSLGDKFSPLRAMARAFSVAVVALPLFQTARGERWIFAACLGLALASGFASSLRGIENLSLPIFGGTAIAAWLVARRLAAPS